MTDNDDQELQSHFEFVDLDGNGEIDLEEFRRLLKDLGMTRGDEVVEHAFRDIDSDGSGAIDFVEFSAWWRGGSKRSDGQDSSQVEGTA